MLLVRIPFWSFAIAGFAAIIVLSTYVTNQFSEISAMEQATDSGQSSSFITKTVNSQEKNKIDEWLTKNNLNEFGDQKNVLYTGGTPLFDESTGKRTDRYVYLISKFPEKPWVKQ